MRSASPACIPILSSVVVAACAARAYGAELPSNGPDPAELQRHLEQTEQKLRDLAEQIAVEQRQLDADRRLLDAYQHSSESELRRAEGKGGAPGPGRAGAPVGEAPQKPAPRAATGRFL